MRAQLIVMLVGLAIATVGCTSKDEAPPTPAAEPAVDPVAEASEIFTNRCTVCHGEKGKGDGPGSAALDPKPRDFTSSDWQNEVTDDHLKKIIVYGGAAVGKSPTMPANPDLDSKPEVVAELVKIIRGLGQ